MMNLSYFIYFYDEPLLYEPLLFLLLKIIASSVELIQCDCKRFSHCYQVKEEDRLMQRCSEGVAGGAASHGRSFIAHLQGRQKL